MSATPDQWLLLSVPIVPLLAGIALALWPGSRMLRALAPWCVLPGLLAGWLLPETAVGLPWVLQGTEFALDETGRVFLLASAAIGWAAGIAASGGVRERRGRFLSFHLLVMTGALGATVAADLLTFYLGFSLMSFAACGLIVHDRSQRARYAVRVYLSFVLAADMIVFAALVLIMQDTAGDAALRVVRSVLPSATYGSLALVLLVIGFGVKIGLLGLHVTLPLIYAAAPAPAGVVLAGVMVNIGLLGWIRLLPLGLGTMPEAGGVLALLGAAAAFLGAVAGSLQRHPGAVLGYSSISQMGIVTMAVGIGLSVDDGSGLVLAAVILYAVHHALAKSALFLGAAVAATKPYRQRGWLAVGLLLPVLALAGAPLTSGMLAKETLKAMSSIAPAGWQAPLKAALPWMAVATTLVLARYLWLVWPGRARGCAGTPAPGLLVGWCVLLVLGAAAVWFLPLERPAELWSAATVLEVTWPVLVGVLLAGVALGSVRRFRLGVPPLPAGDVLVIYRAAVVRVIRGERALGKRCSALFEAIRRRRLVARAREPLARAAGGAEQRLVDWPVAITLLLLTILAWWSLPLIG